MNLRQLYDRESSTYTYLIWDEETAEAALIDPVDTQVERDLRLVGELGLKLRYTFETHIHADHITGSGRIRESSGARTVLHRNSGADCADLLVVDGDQFSLGDQVIQVMETPGHTNTCVCYQISGVVFTGDTLLIRGCGRTDFQSGDPGKLYDSIHEKLFPLPDDTVIYPAHDYHGLPLSTIGEERAYNPRLGNNRSRRSFIELMDNLVLEP
ncbi:MAG: MBL fold metallo-hydrolase, partial [Gammaproteobacteria bacterium]|nr:MBL fold metallo-hydrolase [Gammaproteobacteria bacterium]